MKLSLKTLTVLCEFLDLSMKQNGLKHCSIAYGPDGTCDMRPSSVQSASEPISNNSAIINLPNLPHLKRGDLYCFIVTAGDGTFVTTVEGRFGSGKNTSNSHDNFFVATLMLLQCVTQHS